MKRIVIDVWDESDDVWNGNIEIYSKEYEFDYVSLGLNKPRGMQCRFWGDTEEYESLLEALDELHDIIRRIEHEGLAGD